MPRYRETKKTQCFSNLVFNSFNRNTQMIRNLPVGHLFDPAEQKYDPAFVGQLTDRCLNPLAQFIFLQGQHGFRLDGGCGFPGFGRVQLLPLMLPGIPDVVESPGHRHPAEIGGHRRMYMELVPFRPQFGKHFLGHVFCLVPVTENPVYGLADKRVMLFEQKFNRCYFIA